MTRAPLSRDNRRTGDQVLIDANTEDITDLTKRVVRLEQLVYWALGGGAVIVFIIGLFAKQVAKLVLP